MVTGKAYTGCSGFLLMKRVTAVLSGVLLAILVAVPAMAGQVSLKLHDGRVTLDAREVSVRQILAEWQKVGGTEFVNADEVAGPAVTLQLTNMPEQEALAIVLQSVAGYMAAPRTTYRPNASVYGRVLILAKSTPPVVTRAPSNRVQPPTVFYPPEYRRLVPPSALRFFRPPPRPGESNGNGGNGADHRGTPAASPGNPVITAPVVSPQPGVIVAPKKPEKPSGGGR